MVARGPGLPSRPSCQRSLWGLPGTQGAGHDPVQLTGETKRQMSGAGPPGLDLQLPRQGGSRGLLHRAGLLKVAPSPV